MNKRTRYFIENHKISISLRCDVRHTIELGLDEYISFLKLSSVADELYVLGWGRFFQVYYIKNDSVNLVDDGVIIWSDNSPNVDKFIHNFVQSESCSAEWIIKIDKVKNEIDLIKGECKW